MPIFCGASLPAAMVGYVVTTWHGRNAWGGLKYWLTTPGRYTTAEAFYLNQQEIPQENNFTVTSELRGKKCIVTVTTKDDFSIR